MRDFFLRSFIILAIHQQGLSNDWLFIKLVIHMDWLFIRLVDHYCLRSLMLSLQLFMVTLTT
jgi:hypothetical protein